MLWLNIHILTFGKITIRDGIDGWSAMNLKAFFTRLLFLFTVPFFVLLLLPCPACLQSPPPELKFTIIPHRSHLGNEQAYSHMITALEEATGFSFAWVASKTYGDVIDKLKNGQADIGYLGPLSYVKAQDSFGVRLIARTVDKHGEEFYRSMIIARKDSGLNSLADLKGKRFAFTDLNSTSGFLFPLAELKKAGIDQADFSEVTYVKRHANSVLAVYYKHSDAGATASTIKDRLDINFDQIKILWESGPIYRGPWAARTDLPEPQFRAIQKALLLMARREDASLIFKELQTNGFVEGADSDYDNVREMVKWTREAKTDE